MKNRKKQKARSRELIETLWNVNVSGGREDDQMSSELIETLWNVNEDHFGGSAEADLRINRNIVECK